MVYIGCSSEWCGHYLDTQMRPTLLAQNIMMAYGVYRHEVQFVLRPFPMMHKGKRIIVWRPVWPF